ncbi:MAG: DNA replication/repair protein RecF [Erysipelotrichaceae bacterium]|nr:DNA replication/repair protein RecF [Erysipelotrichaceae bacterium]
MKINKLKLVNFRNYKETEIEFSKGVNIIVGDNGVGKTNLVEAIDFLTIGKSFKTNDELEMIRFEEEFAKVELDFFRKEKKNIKCVISNAGKRFLYNDIELKKLTELNGKLVDVLFVPEDVSFFKDNPSNRRRFLDLNISFLNKEYLKDLSLYKKLLKERNTLLKEENVDRNYISVIDEQMIEVQYRIITHRKEMVRKLNLLINDKFQNLDQGNNYVSLIYETVYSNLQDYGRFKERLLEIYEEEFETDLRRKSTSRGIHHDNLIMLLNGREIGVYGSQGQNRLGALSLKLSILEILKRELNEEPIVILDDVLSELDVKHQQKLIEELTKIEQVFITCAKEDYYFKDCSTYVVTKDSVIRRN